MESELTEYALNLGNYVDGKYQRSYICADILVDLIDFLHHADQKLERYLAFYRSKIIQDDIVPLICSMSDDKEVVLQQFRLFYLVTRPASCILAEIEISKNKYNFYSELIQLQMDLKSQLSNSAILSAMKNYFRIFMNSNNNNERMIYLLLEVFINLFNEEDYSRIIDYKSYSVIYEALIRKLFENDIHTLFLFMSNGTNFANYSFHVLGALYSALHFINVESIAMWEKESINSQTKSLSDLVAAEQKKREIDALNKRTRHGGFGGTVVKEIDQSTNVVVINPSSNLVNQSLQHGKNPMKKTKRQQEPDFICQFRDLPDDLHKVVSRFCSDIIIYAFNSLIQRITNIQSDYNLKDTHDHYLWFLGFFLKLNRLSGSKVDYVARALDVDHFNTPYSLIMDALDKLQLDKKNHQKYIYTINSAILLFHELYDYLNTLLQSNDTKILHSTEILTSNIFYVSEYKEIFLVLFKKYRKDIFPFEFSKNLFLAYDRFFNVLRRFYSKKGPFQIQRKLKMTSGSEKRSQTGPSWDFIREKLLECEAVSFDQPPKELVFSQTLPYDEQIRNLKEGISTLMINDCYSQAIVAFRSFLAHLGQNPTSLSPDILRDMETIYNLYGVTKLNGDEDTSSNSSFCNQDKQFNLNKYMTRYACLAVSKVCARLLWGFEENTTQLNDALNEYIDYVSFSLNLPQLFYHISFLRAFLRILNSNSKFANLQQTLTRLTTQFFSDVSNNDYRKIAHVLFWKPLHEQTKLYSQNLDLSNHLNDHIYGTRHKLSNSCSSGSDSSCDSPSFSGRVNSLRRCTPMSDLVEAHINNNFQNRDIAAEDGKLNGYTATSHSSLFEDESSWEEHWSKSRAKNWIMNDLSPPQFDNFLKTVKENSEALCIKGYVNLLEWIIRNIETEEQQRHILLLKKHECLQIIPDPVDVIRIKNPLVVAFLNNLGFLPPTDDQEDPYWKIPPGSKLSVAETIKMCI